MNSRLSSFPEIENCEILIAGSGILGLTIAWKLKEKYPQKKIIILEKESVCGYHASSRNSGVLHSGFYYSQDSLKARHCKLGNLMMKEFLKANSLPLKECQKLLVIRTDKEKETAQELLKRADANGVRLLEITKKEALEIQSGLYEHFDYLLSPDTALTDPKTVIQYLFEKLSDRGVKFLLNEKLMEIYSSEAVTDKRKIHFELLINTCGLQADQIAGELASGYTILPFKGLYLKSKTEFPLNTHIYPVPDLKNPFLGVHLTLSADQYIKIGPTALPCFWRENYGGLERFDLSEFLQITGTQIKLLWNNSFSFRDLAFQEMSKMSPGKIFSLANQLYPLGKLKFKTAPAGIRAQLLDLKTMNLVMDFLWKKKENQIHILNAVSPAFTCSFSMAEEIINDL